MSQLVEKIEVAESFMGRQKDERISELFLRLLHEAGDEKLFSQKVIY